MSGQPSVDDLFDNLRRAGWQMSEKAAASNWRVSGTCGGITLHTEGGSREEAWRRAWEQARAAGPSPPAGQGWDRTLLFLARVLLIGVAGALGLCLLWSGIFFTDASYGPYFQVRSDIGELESALAACRTACHVSYVPSRIKLSETCNYPQRHQPNTLDFDSVQFLRTMWPRIVLEPGTRIDWNGDGRVQGDWVLEGDECLVFFLGGIPVGPGGTPGCMGFATNPRNPASPNGPHNVPFFEFKSYRLRDLHGRGFYSYLDAYSTQPYAYFSAYGQMNGYNRYGRTDCPALGVWPYAQSLGPTLQFVNPRSFQIISAGADGKFGPGTDCAAHVWTPFLASTIPADGRDDLANFSSRRLGDPGGP
jgi:hypothetical protein